RAPRAQRPARRAPAPHPRAHAAAGARARLAVALLGAMAISPFNVRPASPEGERRRARLAVAIATGGIVAILLAYAISPGVRHVVSHAAHSVKHAVGHVFDHDHQARPHTNT